MPHLNNFNQVLEVLDRQSTNFGLICLHLKPKDSHEYKIQFNQPNFYASKLKRRQHNQCYLSNPTKNAHVAIHRFSRRRFKRFFPTLRNAGIHLGGRVVACSQKSRGFGGLLVTQMRKSDQRSNAQMDAIKEGQKTTFPYWASCPGPRLAPGQTNHVTFRLEALCV